MKYYLGIDAGASSFKCGVVDEDNDIVYKSFIKTNNNQTNEEALNNLSILIDDAKSKYKLESIGVGLPCVVNNDKIIMAPNLPNWDNIDFGTYLRTKYKLPIAIDNDANAGAVAELVAGNGKDLDNFVYITLGTGIGGAIIINKQIYRGNIGGAGEIGHILTSTKSKADEKYKYRVGTLELRAGRYGIIHTYKELAAQNKIKVQNIDVKDIVDLADKGNQIAIQTLTKTEHQLGCAIITINHILDIGNFIVGGGISQSKLLLNTAEITAKERTLPSVSKVNIIKAKYMQSTGIIGAALLGKTRGAISFVRKN